MAARAERDLDRVGRGGAVTGEHPIQTALDPWRRRQEPFWIARRCEHLDRPAGDLGQPPCQALRAGEEHVVAVDPRARQPLLGHVADPRAHQRRVGEFTDIHEIGQHDRDIEIGRNRTRLVLVHHVGDPPPHLSCGAAERLRHVAVIPTLRRTVTADRNRQVGTGAPGRVSAEQSSHALAAKRRTPQPAQAASVGRIARTTDLEPRRVPAGGTLVHEKRPPGARDRVTASPRPKAEIDALEPELKAGVERSERLERRSRDEQARARDRDRRMLHAQPSLERGPPAVDPAAGPGVAGRPGQGRQAGVDERRADDLRVTVTHAEHELVQPSRLRRSDLIAEEQDQLGCRARGPPVGGRRIALRGLEALDRDRERGRHGADRRDLAAGTRVVDHDHLDRRVRGLLQASEQAQRAGLRPAHRDDGYRRSRLPQLGRRAEPVSDRPSKEDLVASRRRAPGAALEGAEPLMIGRHLRCNRSGADQIEDAIEISEGRRHAALGRVSPSAQPPQRARGSVAVAPSRRALDQLQLCPQSCQRDDRA